MNRYTPWIGLNCLLCLVLATSSHALGQDPPKEKKETKETEKVPDPEKVQLVTKRTGLNLAAMFFPSTKSKDAAPIILLHGWKESGSLYYKLAKELQTLGYAVIVPDLRGHGASRNAIAARDGVIDLDKMSKAEMSLIVGEDLESIKSFLLDRHNEGKLNIELLSVIGIGEGSFFGSSWALKDWEYPPLPGIKQGQDVKAVIMISPVMTMKGTNAENGLKNPLFRQMSFLVISGADAEERSTVGRIAKNLEKSHTLTEDPIANPDATFWLLKPKTSLAKAQLIGNFPGTVEAIDTFLQKRVKSFAKSVPWSERKRKIQP